VPQPRNKLTSHIAAIPDYAGLVRFLVQPFLESPDCLSVDCEISPNTARVWIRVAFEGEDKGRVFGRGGRNIQAIRTVMAAAAASSGHVVYLDIYGSQAQERESMSDAEQEAEQIAPISSRERPVTDSKSVDKPRLRSSSN